MVPFHCGTKTPGKGKTNPVVGQFIFQHKKFCPLTAETLPFTKHLPNIIPSLQMLLPPKAKRAFIPFRNTASFGGAASFTDGYFR
jgi:hypothetical protein